LAQKEFPELKSVNVRFWHKADVQETNNDSKHTSTYSVIDNKPFSYFYNDIFPIFSGSSKQIQNNCQNNADDDAGDNRKYKREII